MAVGIAAALVLSGCGSTVQWQGQVTAGAGLGVGAPGDGTGRTDPGTVDGAAPGTDAPTGQAPGGSASARPGGSAVPGQAASKPSSQGGPAAPPPGKTGRGYTKKEIFIGFATQKDAASLGKAFGAGVDFGDQEATAKAVVKEINRQGGVAGRKLVLVFYDIKSSESTQDPNRVAQAACERWTKDTQVFAVMSVAAAINTDTLFSCLAKRQTPIVINDVGMHATAQMSRYAGYLYAPSVPSLDRLVPTWMQRAAGQGYFKGGWDTLAGGPGSAPMKIGLVDTKNPGYGGGNLAPIVEKALARQGLSVAAKFQHSGDVSSMSGEMKQAVLRFQQANVTHVISDAWALLFMQAAESQNYRPRYALTSFQALSALQDTVPQKQLGGSVGVGYVPTIDVDNGRDPGDVSSAQERCRNVVKQAGQNTSARQAMLIAFLVCDGFNFLTSAVEKGGLSPAGMQQGAKAMGSLAPAATFRISFPGGRQDGVSVARDLAFRASCSGRPGSAPGCFTYAGTKNVGM